MHRRVASCLALLPLAAAGCIVSEDAKPEVGFGATLATRFVHRGMTLVDNPVVIGELGVQLPTIHGDTLAVEVEGAMELRNDTGGAWFPDGHAGRFTQIEFQASHQRQFGDVAVRAGVHSYNLPNGLEFVNGERGGTTEVFVLASANVLEASPYFGIHYDFDEVRGGYYRAGIAEDIPLGADWSLALDGSLGYASEAQAVWMYGLPDSGLADLRGEAVLRWQYDKRTRLLAGVHGSMMVNSDQDRWFRDLGIDDDPIWFTFGVNWVF